MNNKGTDRMRGCACWSAPLLFAYDIRHVFSWSGSHVFQWYRKRFNYSGLGSSTVQLIICYMLYPFHLLPTSGFEAVRHDSKLFLMVVLLEYIWATTRQNHQNGLRAQRRLSVFSVRMTHEETLGPQLSMSVKRRLRSDWAGAQADLSLRWAHRSFCWFVMSRLMVRIAIFDWMCLSFMVHSLNVYPTRPSKRKWLPSSNNIPFRVLSYFKMVG